MKFSGLNPIRLRDMSMLCPIGTTMLGHVLAILGAMFWLFLQYLCFQTPESLKSVNKESSMPTRRILLILNQRDYIGVMFGPYKGNILPILGLTSGHLIYHFFASRRLKGLKSLLNTFAGSTEKCHVKLNN